MKLQNNSLMRKYTKEVFERAYNLMDLDEPIKLVFTTKEYNKIAKKQGFQTKRKSNLLGFARKFCGYRIVLIHIENHRSVKGLNDTIVHELYHHKNFKLRHGKEFDNKVEEYLKQLFDYGFNESSNKVIEYQSSKY